MKAKVIFSHNQTQLPHGNTTLPPLLPLVTSLTESRFSQGKREPSKASSRYGRPHNIELLFFFIIYLFIYIFCMFSAKLPSLQKYNDKHLSIKEF